MKKSTRRACRFSFRVVTFLLCLAVLVTLFQIPSRIFQKEDVLESYIARSFSVILGRDATIEDLRFWYQNLQKGNASAVSMIDNLMEGSEFEKRELSLDQKLDIVYESMLGRPADENGKEYWLRYLNGGVSKALLVHTIANTQEFKSFCSKYSVKPGDVSITEERDLDPNMTLLVSKLSRTVLGKNLDNMELNSWIANLGNNEVGLSTLMLDILKRKEFVEKGYSREETVRILFESMLEREPSEQELTEYINILEHGVSMEYVLDQISKLPEYQMKWVTQGVSTGNITLTQPRDLHYELTGFIARFYEKLSGHVATEEELNDGIGKILSGDLKITDMLTSVLESPESQETLASNEDFVNAVYEVLYGTVPDADLAEGYRIGLDHGITRAKVLKEIMKAPSFNEKMTELGVPVTTEKVIPEKVIALTFDDGPYTPVTFRILDALKPYDGHATFFVVGNRVDPYSECVIRAVNQDCEIGNHTWNHTTLTKISGDSVAKQMNDCDSAVYNLAGVHTKVMRPVGGSYNNTVANNVDRPMIIWSVDTNDWKYRDSNHVINEILNNVRDGDIILMHDIYETTAAAVEYVVPELIERGYTLVTLSELAEYKGIDLKAGEAYFSIRG